MKPRNTVPKHSADLLIELVDHLDTSVAYWNADQVCLLANAPCAAWFGRGRSDVVGTTVQQLLGPLYAQCLPFIEAAYRGEKQVFELDMPAPDGEVRSSRVTCTPHEVGGRVRGIFVQVADVGPLKRLERELKETREKAGQLATHDFLTGLPNRALLQNTLDHALALTRRAADTMAVMSLDIDGFKPITVRHGQGEGDRLLIEVASRVRATVRESDTVLRLAGDAFIVVATALASGQRPTALATRILEALRQPLTLGRATVRPSASIGIALFPVHGTSTEALVAASDAALREAKRTGRDRWVVAS